MHGIKKLSNVCSSNFRNRLKKFPPSAGFPTALRGSGAVSAAVGVPLVPMWETAAFGGGERIKKENWGATGAPVGASAYTAFGGDTKK